MSYLPSFCLKIKHRSVSSFLWRPNWTKFINLTIDTT